MKIAFLITRADDIGGAQIHVRDLSFALLKMGVEVSVLAGQGGVLSEELSKNGVRSYLISSLVRPISPLKDLLAIQEITGVLKGIKPDLLSCHSSKAGWIGRIAGRIAGIPTIFTAHGWSFTGGVPSKKAFCYRLAERVIAPLSSKIITVSEYDKQLAIDFRIANFRKIEAIHNGMPDISKDCYAKPNIQPPKILMVARFDEQKDHLTLITAIKPLTDLSWELLFIGDGPFRENVENFVKENGLGNRVVFLGQRKDVSEQLANAQMFVLSTNWEGFPRSILEAMRAGLPVIASNVGGVSEAILDGETGFLTSRGDPDELRRHLRCLIENPTLRVRLGEAGRSRFEREFTFDQMFEKTLKVYDSQTFGSYSLPRNQ